MFQKMSLYKSSIKTFGFWAFAIIIGISLAYLEEVDNIEPLFSIAAFFYWALLIYWTLLWFFKQIKAILKQKKEKNHTELLHLQSQVNPHFFFNILNNLYGLVDKDAEKAKNLILKLSDLMRYSIYEGEKETVILEEEIAYLKNYIALHKLRYHKEIDIDFNINIDNKTYKILPLLFIILLENAFKHGVENLTKEAYVHLKLEAKNNAIIFEIENNFDDETISEKKGIGLKNLKRRLELKYPKKHIFTSALKENVYKTKLVLNL